MKLKSLHLQNFRNFTAGGFSAGDGANLFVGSNGSGKTSLLEAIYLLGRTRSFRTAHLTHLVKHDQTEFVVRGEFADDGGTSHHIGCGKRKGVRGVQVRLDGGDVERRDDVGSLFPVILVNSDSYRLVEGGPKYRRQFVDWGLFHVEHVGREVWREYRRVLRQRNAALKGPRQALQTWTRELASYGVRLDYQREQFIERINPAFSAYGSTLLGRRCRLAYRVPWGSTDDLERELVETVERDRRAGFTKSGPHAANIAVEVEGLSSREELSRGQTKIAVFALMLSLVDILKSAKGTESVMLVDDMAAELDSDNQRSVLEVLDGLGTQLFITGTELPGGLEALSVSPRVFHVKHGAVDVSPDQ